MSLASEQIAQMQQICPGAREVEDAGQAFVYLPGLKVQVGAAFRTMNALLCPTTHSGYVTRLFLSDSLQADCPTIKGSAANWTTHTILGVPWHTWSWNNVSSSLPLSQMLLCHLDALR